MHISNYVYAFKERKSIVPRQDYEWIEVTRGRTDCLLYQYIAPTDTFEERKHLLSEYYEGFSRGWPDFDTLENISAQPYGCWFHIARGTGIYVNVGKTLVTYSRKETNFLLGISDRSDFDVCKKVIEKGYDSIQMYNAHAPLYTNEFVYCTGKCATDPVKSACPPLELRTGWNATKRCECNDTFPIVNCNNKLTDIMDCFSIKPPKYRFKQTCYFEDFNWINIFQSSWDGSIGIFILWDRNSVQALPKLKSIISTHQKGGWATIVVDSGQILLDSAANHTYIFENLDNGGFDIVPILKKSEHAIKNRSKYKFITLSLTVPDFLRSTTLKRAGVKIGFISYSLHNLNIDNVNKMAQLVLDEAMCLKRSADIIVLLSASDVFVDNYIVKKVGKFVDMIVGGNAQEHLSCNGKFHTNNDNAVIHAKRDGSYLIKISIDVVDKNKFSFKNEILDLSIY